MINTSDKPRMKTRHPSLEKPDPDADKKKHHPDILKKAKIKFFSLSDALKTNKVLNGEADNQKRPKSHPTLDHLFKPYFPHKNHPLYDPPSFQKQHSVGAYPIKIEITEDLGVFDSVSRIKSATLPYEKREELRETAALALERPRKKLSFREPEISGYATLNNAKSRNADAKLKTSRSVGNIGNSSSWDDLQLESQAMRIVRTVGQAFEVCHKVSAPERTPPDHDEQETLTQDLVSDHISDILSDRPKKDLLSETLSDRNSLPCEENILDDVNCIDAAKTPRNFNCSETVPPSSAANNTRKSHLVSGETYASPPSDTFVTTGSGSGSMTNTMAFSTGSALSSHHEIQLLKEQYEQQSQQTQAALAQLQLVREQLAAEQSARMEAQARTHQLLVHNKELLDHIAALVSHLQGGEKGSAQSHPGPHLAMPQQQHNQAMVDGYIADCSESSPLEQSYQNYQPQNLIENHMVTNCLPPSPLRTSYPPSGTVFNFNYPTSYEASLEAQQLVQRLQTLNCYPQPQYPYGYQQYIPQNVYSTPQMLTNTYTLQPPPQKKISTTSLPIIPSYNNSPVLDRKGNPMRNDYQHQQDQSCLQVNQLPRTGPQPQVQQVPHLQKPQLLQTPLQNNNCEPQFIKPLSQLGTLTTTDIQGRVRVIVPIPAQAPDDDGGNLLASLRLGDNLRPMNTITRSTSEKVPHRSELMSQVQRTAWARHTTK